MDNNGHRCIYGVSGPHGMMFRYDDNDNLFIEHGCMKFRYCPICGRANKPVALHDQVKTLVAEYGTDAVLSAAGRL